MTAKVRDDLWIVIETYGKVCHRENLLCTYLRGKKIDKSNRLCYLS